MEDVEENTEKEVVVEEEGRGASVATGTIDGAGENEEEEEPGVDAARSKGDLTPWLVRKNSAIISQPISSSKGNKMNGLQRHLGVPEKYLFIVVQIAPVSPTPEYLDFYFRGPNATIHDAASDRYH